MTQSLFLHILPLLVAALLATGLFLAAAPQRAVPGVRWFMAFSMGIVFWSLGYVAELAIPGLGAKVIAAKIQYFGVAFVPVAWLLFAVEYAGVTWPRWITVGTFGLPMVTLFLAWTNDLHGLIWAETVLRPGPGFTLLGLSYGPWFWVHAGYSYVLLLLSAVLLVRVIMVRPPLFRRQAIMLLLGCISPWLGNALYLTGKSPNSLDLTVFGFAIAAIMAGWAILRWQLLSVGPIARDTLVEGMAEGMAVVDVDGLVVDANPAAATILGTPATQLVGRPAKDVLAPFVTDLSPSEGSVRTVDSPSGDQRYDARIEPLHDRRGRHRGWTLVLYDVTRREEEAEILLRARRAAEETARAQRAFMTNMNHELRTPLNGVLGMLQVLEQGDLDPVSKHYVSLANRSGEQLLTLVDRLLDFASIETGHVELAHTPFDVNQVVRAVVETYRPRVEGKGLALHFTPAEGIPSDLLGDPGRLAQVVDGLLSNAVKFTEEGHVHVRLSRRGQGDGTVPVRVEVFDSGVGIPADRLQAIFRNFEQADGSTTRRHEGAGIGLSLSQKLVARMGGCLDVESEVGRGSRFWFLIPFPEAQPSEPAPTPSPESTPT